jgi:putative transposase
VWCPCSTRAVLRAPLELRIDIGLAFIPEALRSCCKQHGIALAFTELSKRDQNFQTERFHRRFRHEVLDAWVVTLLDEAPAVSKCGREASTFAL